MLHATLPILPACGSCTSSGYPVTAGALLTHASLAQLAVWQGAMRTGSRRRSRTRPYCCAAFAARAPASRFRDGFNKFFQPSSASTRAKRAERLCMVLRCAARLRVCLRVRDVERLGRMVPITNHPHFTRRCVNAAAQTICPRAAHRTHGRRARADNTHAAGRATAACARGCTRSTRPPPCPRCSGGGAGGGLARDAPGRAPDGQHAAQQGCGHGRLRALVLRKAPRGEPPMRPVARAMTPAVRPAKRAPPAARGRHAVPAFARGRRARSGCGAGSAGAAHRVWKGRGRQEHDGRWGRASSDGGRRGQTCAPGPPTLPGERPGRRLPSSVATSRRRGAEGRAGGCLVRHERGAKEFQGPMGMHGARKAGSGP